MGEEYHYQSHHSLQFCTSCSIVCYVKDCVSTIHRSFIGGNVLTVGSGCYNRWCSVDLKFVQHLNIFGQHLNLFQGQRAFHWVFIKRLNSKSTLTIFNSVLAILNYCFTLSDIGGHLPSVSGGLTNG